MYGEQSSRVDHSIRISLNEQVTEADIREIVIEIQKIYLKFKEEQ